MMNPNNLILETKTESVQKDTIIGMLLPEGNVQTFILLNVGAGSLRVSGNTEVSNIATKALTEQYTYQPSFQSLLTYLGATSVDNKGDADIDLSLESLEKDTILNLIS